MPKIPITGLQVSRAYGKINGCVFFRHGKPHYYRLYHRPSRALFIESLAIDKWGCRPEHCHLTLPITYTFYGSLTS